MSLKSLLRALGKPKTYFSSVSLNASNRGRAEDVRNSLIRTTGAKLSSAEGTSLRLE